MQTFELAHNLSFNSGKAENIVLGVPAVVLNFTGGLSGERASIQF